MQNLNLHMTKLRHTMQEYAVAIYNTIAFSIAWVMTYTGFPLEPVAILASLMVADFFSGIIRAYTLGECISSRRMKVGALGKLSLLFFPLVVALAMKGLSQNWEWLLKYAINLMILAEVYSFTANLYAAKNKRDLPELDVLAIFARKIRDIAENLLDIDRRS